MMQRRRSLGRRSSAGGCPPHTQPGRRSAAGRHGDCRCGNGGDDCGERVAGTAALCWHPRSSAAPGLTHTYTHTHTHNKIHIKY